MKSSLLTSIPVAIALSSCASLGSGPNAAKRTLVGASAGAAIGAAVGGVNGAGLGAVAGGALGALAPASIIHGRQYYRDSRGYCYYVDRKGKPHYTRRVTADPVQTDAE